LTQHLVVGPWGARYMGRRFPCAVGRGGIGDKRAEGDGMTPAGVHRIEAVLVRRDRAGGVGFAYDSRRIPVGTFRGSARARAVPIGPRDGWSDDPADPAYNRPVRRPHRFGHEALRRGDPCYDLVAVLDWNRHPATPGRGSAIFLHVWRAPRHPTAGCIGFRRADLAWILARWTPRSRVVARHSRLPQA
jgi:L,D-peptidoglycan transpeptidase YkuD (ErfK/YbiS/YcfS/YnhG family)